MALATGNPIAGGASRGFFRSLLMKQVINHSVLLINISAMSLYVYNFRKLLATYPITAPFSHAFSKSMSILQEMRPQPSVQQRQESSLILVAKQKSRVRVK
jgi:hypothetical protein